MRKDPKKLVMEMVRLVGRPEAERLLIVEKVSPSLAGKLVRGKYASSVGALVAEKIEIAWAAAESLANAG